MRIRFTCKANKPVFQLNEKTYTINGVQYWKRNGKFCKWTEKMGRIEIPEEEYLQALASMNTGATPSKEDVSKKERKPVEVPKNYKEAKPEDLALLAKEGNKKAEEEIIKRYQPLVHKIANKYFIQGGDHDDLVQDGMIAVWEAIQGYDPDRVNNFTSFLSTAINNRMKICIRDDNTEKTSMLNGATSMDATATGGDGSDDEGRTLGETLPSKGPSIEEDMLGKEGAKRITDFIRNLPEKERLAISGVVEGKKIPEIAEELGVSYKTVENAVMRARNKIRDYMKMEESRKLRLKENNEHDDDLDESSFDYDGVTYTSKWGIYYKGKDEITRDEYHQAMDLYNQSNVDKENLFNKGSNDTVDRANRFKEFYQNCKVVSYEIERDTRGHLPRIDKDDKGLRVSCIQDEIGCDEDTAKLINKAISEYTAVDQCKLDDAAMMAINTYIEKGKVYNAVPLFRGMGFKRAYQDDEKYYNDYVNIQVGDYLPLWGIASTTSNPDVCCNFGDSNGEMYVLIVITKNLSGVSIDHLTSSRYKEGEVLFTKDTKFKVIRKEVDDDTVYLEVQEVDKLEEDISIAPDAHVVDQNVGLHKPQEDDEDDVVELQEGKVEESTFKSR